MKPYNVRGKGRHYKSPKTNQDLPSVTNILNCYPKQDALVHWAANRQKELDVLAAYQLYQSGLEFIDANHFRQRLDEAIGKQRQHIKDLEKARNIGSLVHQAIEHKLRSDMGLPVDSRPELEESALWAYMAWEDWWKEVEIRPIALEKFVWSDVYGFAGTTDLIAQIKLSESLYKRLHPKMRSLRVMNHLGEWVLADIDFKTGKGVYPDMMIQLAAYLQALTEMEVAKEDSWGMIVRLPKNDDDPEFEVRFLHPAERQQKFNVFLALMKVWEDKVNG